MRKLTITAAAAAAAMSVSAANAAPVTFEIWDVIAGEAETQVQGSYLIEPDYLDGSAGSVQGAIASRDADLIFTLDSSLIGAGFEESSRVGAQPGNETIGDFFNITAADVTGGTVGAALLGNYLLGTVARITATVDVPNAGQLGIRSDDGYLVTIDGEEIARKGGLFPPTTTNYSLASVYGREDVLFEMLWYEGKQVDAALKIDVNNVLRVRTPQPVPLPAGVWLIGTAVAGFGVMSRRKRKSA